MTATQIVVNGSSPIIYGNTGYFGFELKTGSDTLSLQGATLQTDQTDAISDGTAVSISGGGVLNLGGATETVASITVESGRVVNGTLLSGSRVVQSGDITANLSGEGSLTKAGDGTVTLSSTNTYTGGTTVLGGTLVVSNVSALPQGGALTIDGTGSVVLSSGLGVSSVSEGSVSSGVAGVSNTLATPMRRIPPWVANRTLPTVSQAPATVSPSVATVSPSVATVSPSSATTTAPAVAVAVSQPVATTSQVVAATSQPAPVISRTSFSMAQTPATVIQPPVKPLSAATAVSLIDAKAHDVVLQLAVARPDALEMAWLWDLMQSSHQRRSTTDGDLAVKSLDEVLAQYGQ
jgi:autotransporter-associated beta strand protein